MDTLNFSEQIPEALPYSASIREIMQHINLIISQLVPPYKLLMMVCSNFG